MGYYISTHKGDGPFDPLADDFLIATDEELKVARLAFHSECDDVLLKVKEDLPEELANIVYKRFLVYYIKQIQDWMNTQLGRNIFGPSYKPSEIEEATRCIFVRGDLLHCVEEYHNSQKCNLAKHEYYFSKMPDNEAIEAQKKFQETEDRPSEEGLLPIGASAFHLIDYKKILTVTITNRKGFLYYCETDDGHQYIVPCHQMFPTVEDAQVKIKERNNRRNSAIAELHLLKKSEDESVNQDRQTALEWLNFNQDPPELLYKRLKRFV